jgi:carbon starvation protein
MSFAILGSLFLFLLFISYRYYSAYLARQFGLDDKLLTPSKRNEDGVDFVPTPRFYLFAQHFSGISAAGPIAGPILACVMWGWLPCLIWIAMGVVLIGATHDFASLIASVRHNGGSIAEITKERVGPKAGVAFMIFMWVALIYVIVAFTDITAGSFVGITEELASHQVLFNPGGAVAAAAVMYLVLSLIMGLFQKIFKPHLLVTTLIFVPLAFAAVWFGSHISTWLIFDAKTWCLFILLYCLVASLLPVWLLLQPRGYLGGFFLYTVLAIGLMGIFFGNYEIKQEAFKNWDSGKTAGSLFPFLFVTIACGACSGFHGLVCSGTTSKQVAQESHTRAIGYGAMLCEAFVALIALVCVMIWSPEEIAGLKPGTIYGKSIGEFLSLLVGKEYLPLAITFGAMAFSTFVFDTLDMSTRLGRYLLQELFRWKGAISALVCTSITIAIPLVFVTLAHEGSYLSLWTLFGASNQLLAALTLGTITIWLYQSGKKLAFTLLPMLFILTVTLWALCDLAWTNLVDGPSFSMATINGLVSIALIVLAMYLVISAWLRVRMEVYGKKTFRHVLEREPSK